MGGEKTFRCPEELALSPNTEVLQMVFYFLSLMIKRSGMAFLRRMNLLLPPTTVVLFSTEQ